MLEFQVINIFLVLIHKFLLNCLILSLKELNEQNRLLNFLIGSLEFSCKKLLIATEFNCLIILLSSSRFSQTQRSSHVFYRHDLINQLQHNHALVTLVAENLATYMESMRLYARGMYLL